MGDDDQKYFHEAQNLSMLLDLASWLILSKDIIAS